MNKIITIILCLAMIAGIIGVTAGCSKKSNNDVSTTEPLSSSNAVESESIKIVTTIFPVFDWVRQIIGDKSDKAEITMLLDNGVDLHSYQPTADDLMKISKCDMFIYVGGESDEWVEDALATADNKDMVVVNLLEVLGEAVKEEEIKEGMQADEHEHDENEDHEDEDHEHEEETEFDEHVWLSLKNAETLCKVISEKLGEIDSENKDAYSANANSYIEKLNALDDQYGETTRNTAFKTVLFGDRFPFRYLVDDYGLDYYAAFVGCSAESEASFETIVFLANKVDELGLNAILQIEHSDGKIAQTIKENTQTKDQKILTLDSMQSTSSTDIENGVTYLTIMEKNLNVLKDALN